MPRPRYRSSANAKSAEMSRELQSIESNNTTGQQQGAINDGNVHRYTRSERARKAMAELLEAIYEDSDDMNLSGSNTPSCDDNNPFKDGDVAGSTQVDGSENASLSISEVNASAQGEIMSMLQEVDIAAAWAESS
ncbi:unnamed protein product [Somion occarium]|uniref:Uncharacterized protein n=1 Tax=Somion occarium TaxID=3059160 RepID=A0ABP1DER4_9APHY